MARLAFILLGALFHEGCSLRTRAPEGWIERPRGPEVGPVGRHIQMLYVDAPHGLSDRMLKYFRPLIALGKYHNATVHLALGTLGPRHFLSWDHSLEIAESWGRYFDLAANGGNPWHDLKKFTGCREVVSFKPAELLHLFEGGELCVNFHVNLGAMPVQLSHAPTSLPASQEILEAAMRFRRRYGIPGDYGSVHVRRCDLLVYNAHCTEPASIARMIQEQGQGLQTWLVFLYAEEGYREDLRKALEPMHLHLIFEDEAVLNEAHPEDNYFTYLLGKYLNGGARTILETHHCGGGEWPAVLSGQDLESHGLFLPRWAAKEGVEDEARAICDGAPRGAKLLHPPQKEPRGR